jgi:transposase-like protein
MAKRRQFTAAFKAQVVQWIISRWRRQFLENAASVFEKSTAAGGEAEARIASGAGGGKKSLHALPVARRRMAGQLAEAVVSGQWSVVS